MHSWQHVQGAHLTTCSRCTFDNIAVGLSDATYATGTDLTAATYTGEYERHHEGRWPYTAEYEGHHEGRWPYTAEYEGN